MKDNVSKLKVYITKLDGPIILGWPKQKCYRYLGLVGMIIICFRSKSFIMSTVARQSFICSLLAHLILLMPRIMVVISMLNTYVYKCKFLGPMNYMLTSDISVDHLRDSEDCGIIGLC